MSLSLQSLGTFRLGPCLHLRMAEGPVGLPRSLLLEQLWSWGIEESLALTAVASASTVRELLENVLERVPGDIAVLTPGDAHATESTIALTPTALMGERAAPAAVPHRADEAAALEPAPEMEPTTLTPVPLNPWNAFQRHRAGSGLSTQALSAAYREEAAYAASVSASRFAPGGPSAATGGTTPTATAHPPTLGYLVLRTPPGLERYRGIHSCAWKELLEKFQLTHRAWQQIKTQFYLPKVARGSQAISAWLEQGLVLPVPVFNGQELTPSSALY